MFDGWSGSLKDYSKYQKAQRKKKKTMDIDRLADEIFPDYRIIRFDNLDQAVIGYYEDSVKDSVKLCYSQKKIIEVLQNDMSYMDALEYFSHNIESAHFDGKPIIVMDIDFQE